MTRFVANIPTIVVPRYMCNRLFERRIERAGPRDACSAAPARSCGQGRRIQVGCAVEQQTRAFRSSCRDRDGPALLALHVSGFIGIDDAVTLPDASCVDLTAMLFGRTSRFAGRPRPFGIFAIERRPLRAGLAAIGKAEADLLQRRGVARFAVIAISSGVDFL